MNIFQFLISNIDSYCERIDFTLLSEPLNFFSNFFFIISAILIQFDPKIRQKKITEISQYKIDLWLIRLMYAIGVGSGLFHFFANRLTQILDVVPIGMYIILYLWHWFRHLMIIPDRVSLFYVGIWCGLTMIFTHYLKDYPLGGSQSYLSVALFLPFMGIYQLRRGGSYLLLTAAILFNASLFFRSIDPYVCTCWPYGTHFLWHLLNSLVLYFSTLNSLQLKEKLLNPSCFSPKS